MRDNWLPTTDYWPLTTDYYLLPPIFQKSLCPFPAAISHCLVVSKSAHALKAYSDENVRTGANGGSGEGSLCSLCLLLFKPRHGQKPNTCMKTNITNPFTCLGVASMRSRVLPALIAGLCLIPAGRVTAQTEALILTKPESLLSSVSLQGRFS